MRHTLFYVLPAVLAACEALEPCPAASDDLSAWQIQTNTLVQKVDLPLDHCRRQPDLRAELRPGGRVSLVRDFTLPTRASVQLSAQSRQAAAAAPCFAPYLRVDAVSLQADAADFVVDAGMHVAEVGAQVPADQSACTIWLSPRLNLPSH